MSNACHMTCRTTPDRKPSMQCALPLSLRNIDKQQGKSHTTLAAERRPWSFPICDLLGCSKEIIFAQDCSPCVIRRATHLVPAAASDSPALPARARSSPAAARPVAAAAWSVAAAARPSPTSTTLCFCHQPQPQPQRRTGSPHIQLSSL